MSNSANGKPESDNDESLRQESLRKYRERMFGENFGCECKNQKECERGDCYYKKAKAALVRAHEIRQFEIDLLWKRAAYMATFQTLLFAALGVSFSVDTPQSEPVVYVLRLIICVVGVFSSLFWFAINKGSRFWSQNWEKHIDFLEDEFEGKLYKTVLTGNENRSYSVSRVNISISVMFFATWSILVAIILFDIFSCFNCFASPPYWLVVPALLVLFCILCCCDLHTQFKSVKKGKCGTKADAFFVKRQLPKQIENSPLKKAPIWKEICRFLFCRECNHDKYCKCCKSNCQQNAGK